MPIPVSRTKISRPPSGSTRAPTVTVPPISVNFTAFDSRLRSTWARRRSSPCSIGSVRASSVVSAISAACAAASACRTAARTRRATSTRSDARSKRPDSMRATSRMMLISPSRLRPDSLIWRANSATRAGAGLSDSRSSASEKPITAFSGVRSSWLMVARKRDFAWFAASAASLARRSSSSARRASVTSVNVVTQPPAGVGSERSSSKRPVRVVMVRT